MAITTFAAIDVGSYEVEMVIYEISQRSIKPIDHVRKFIALGRDTYNDQAISFGLVDELCELLYDFVQIMKTYDVKNYRACATSSFREAKNVSNIIDRIKVRTGLKVEVLSNSEQRLITYEAVAGRKEGFNSLIEKGVAMIDVGSGSAQISLFDHGSLITTQNVRLGALRINEVLEHVASGATDKLDMLEEYIDTDVDAIKSLFIKERKIECMIAVGDSINWLIESIDSSEVKEYYTRDEFLEIYHRLYLRNNMRDNLNMNSEQSLLILPSAMIYKKFLDATEAVSLWVPHVRLCDGLAAEFAARERKSQVGEHDFTADIVAAAKNISKRYSWNKEHVKFVEKNALDMFDILKKYHGLGKRERLLLQIACILHDCGQYISMMRASECSYNIIMATEIIGLSHMEREMVANVVKYTTTDFNEDGGMDDFSDEIYLTVSKLTAIAKLSNALDRGHKQKFRNTKYQLEDRNLLIVTRTYEDINLERGLMADKTALFEQVYGLTPVIVQKRG